ncbi:hypothetical protein Vadar_029964 [Vaccinium darrowii]|uniref:Uncharacterized protein n=1 Tax=Vaccinium darrowii TaxID=229202 RepID=A0ACB7X4W6_9ERIC|nr:hypothetical protein Vadar_029964 [Vaccinium darrowii]
MLLEQTVGGELKRRAVKEIATKFFVHRKTVQRIWKRAKSCFVNGAAIDVASKLQTHSGHKRVQIDLQRISGIDLRRRTSLRSLSKALKVPTTTLHRRLKEGAIRPHTSAVKPYLFEDAKKARLRFCLSMLEPSSLETQPVFKDMYNYVHIDEKWFFMTKESEQFYLLPEEPEPLRTCKSKRFITKVMFLAAVARPRFDSTGTETFSGKIGIFPFTYKEPAKRSSKNRATGTLETKAITAVTKDITRSCLIEKILLAIRAKWPRCNETETIYIQQDNAKPHINGLDAQFVEAAFGGGFDIRLSLQPPSSPDMNVLDLGFFREIQSLQHQEAPTTIDELVSAVDKSFEEQSSQSLNQVFLSWQACMVEVMKNFGGNNYKLPHMGKDRLLRNGNLPVQLQCA